MGSGGCFPKVVADRPVEPGELEPVPQGSEGLATEGCAALTVGDCGADGGFGLTMTLPC